MPSWPTMVEETKVRLRASCNACNESKVRCSQSKPTCSRCERNDIDCVYGLSRRTHKDAPPISVTPSQRGRKPLRSGRGSRLTSCGSTATSTGTNGNSPSTTATASNSCRISDESIEVQQANANLLHDYMFPTPTETITMHGAATMMDFGGLLPNNTTGNTTMAPDYFPTSRPEYVNPSTRDLESLFSTHQNNDDLPMEAFQAINSEGECTCHAGVTQLLAMMPGSSKSNSSSISNSNDGRLKTTIDTQLAKLRQCILASETSMRCAHSREDSEPIHIMAIAMLIGYAIDDFKELALESSMRRSSSLSSASSISSRSSSSVAAAATGVATPASTSIPSGLFGEPRLSWGVLELEEDDELDLRHRLYLLSFRKLERLLSQLTMYIQNLHCSLVSLPDPSRHMSFVIVCDYTRLWLEKKAADVKRLLSTSRRNEMMDSVFA